MEIARKVLRQYRIWTPEIATKNVIYQGLTREKKRSFGPLHPDKTFYVIRSIHEKSRFYTGPIHNLLANYFYVISHLFYAQAQGWIPVVDQLNYPVYNSQNTPVNGTQNPWEYFWNQPSSYSLEEVYQSRSVVLSKRNWFGEWDMGYDIGNYTDPDMVSRYHATSLLCPLNEATRHQVSMRHSRLFPHGRKIMGVAVRFEGHAKNCPHPGDGHPIQPEIDDLIELSANYMKAWGMDFVFLTSEEKLAVDQFEGFFGDRLISMPRNRLEAGRAYNKEVPNPLYGSGKMYQTCLDYLTEMELLSRCNALIGSVTSGLRYAVVRNGGRFEHLRIIDRGRFPNRKSGKKHFDKGERDCEK